MKPYVHAVFLRLPCELIPPRQRFHLADKQITVRELNAHVRPARTKIRGCAYSMRYLYMALVRAYYSDDEICVTRTVRCPSRTRTK